MPLVWDSDLGDVMGDIERLVSDKVIATAKEVFDGCVERTPVRSGDLRASWRAYPASQSDLSYETGGLVGSPLSAPVFPMMRLGPYQAVVVSNATPYVDEVEYGGPKNAPHYMMTLTLQSMRN